MHVPVGPPDKFSDCYFFYYSTCKKGSQCPFRHCQAALGTEVTCKHWLAGTCHRLDCPYRHMQIDKRRTNTPCFWETQLGGCRKPHCVFMHSKSRNEQGTIEAVPRTIVQSEPRVQIITSETEREEDSPEDDDLDGAIVIQPVQALRIPSAPVTTGLPLILPSIDMQPEISGTEPLEHQVASSSHRTVIPSEKPLRPKKVIRRPRNDARYIIDKTPAPPTAPNDLRQKLLRKSQNEPEIQERESPSKLETEEELDAGLDEYAIGAVDPSISSDTSLVEAILSNPTKSSENPKPVKLRKRWAQSSTTDSQQKKPRISLNSQDSTDEMLKDVLGTSLDEEEEIDENEALGTSSTNETPSVDSKAASLFGADLAAQLKEQGIELDLDESG